MRKGIIIISLLGLLIFSNLISASNHFGYNEIKPSTGNLTIINNNNLTTNNYYSSLGVNETQIENATIINLKESWLTTFFNFLFRNPFDQVLNTTSNIIFNNVTITEKLGIGTSNPSTNFHVNGGGLFNISTSQDFEIINNSGTSLFRVDGINGYTGINLPSGINPSRPLEVFGETWVSSNGTGYGGIGRLKINTFTSDQYDSDLAFIGSCNNSYGIMTPCFHQKRAGSITYYLPNSNNDRTLIGLQRVEQIGTTGTEIGAKYFMYLSNGTSAPENNPPSLSINGVTRNSEFDGNVTAKWFNGLFNWTSNDDWNIFNGSKLKFNESKLEPTYFNATLNSSIRGTETAGETIQHLQVYDSIPFNVTEEAGANGLDFRLNFTDVTCLNQIIIRYKSTAGESHLIAIQLYNYDDSVWENYGYLSGVVDYEVKTLGVYDPAEHVSSGTVQLRFYQVENGNTNHVHYFDWVTIAKGIGVTTGQEVDPFSWHRNQNITMNGYSIDNVSYLQVNITNTTELIVNKGTDIKGQLKISGASRVRATKTSVQTLTDATAEIVLFDTEVEDNLGEYTPATGTFTASQAGTYLVNWHFILANSAWTVGDYFYSSIRVDDALVAIPFTHYADVAVTNTRHIQGTKIVTLTAGQTIKIGVVVNRGADTNIYEGGSDAIYNQLEIHRLS